MDGVLVDGEPLHFRAVNQLLASEGLSITLEQYKPYMGTKAGWRDMAADLELAKKIDVAVPANLEGGLLALPIPAPPSQQSPAGVESVASVMETQGRQDAEIWMGMGI